MAFLDMESFTFSNNNSDFFTYGRFRNPPGDSGPTTDPSGRRVFVVADYNSLERRILGTVNGPTVGGYSKIFTGNRIFLPSLDGFYQIQFWDIVNNAPQVTVRFEGQTQTISVWRGEYNSAVLLGRSGVGTVPLGTAFFGEASCLVGSGTSGAVVVRVLNQVVSFPTSLIGINTQYTGSASIDTTVHGGGSSTWIQDMYWCDPTDEGDGWNDFQGDGRALGTSPTGAGSLTQSTSSNSNAPWQNAAQTTGFSDANCNIEGTVGDGDRYSFPAPSNVASVGAVMVSIVDRKDNSGDRSIAPQLKMGGTVSVAAGKLQTDTYTTHSSAWTKSPATGNTITAAELALEAGFSVTA